MNGLKRITRDSCCASANFLGQLNGLSIPRTRSLNNKWYKNVNIIIIIIIIKEYYLSVIQLEKTSRALCRNYNDDMSQKEIFFK